MVTICLKCGDKGWDNAYVYCIECLEFSVHRYCLDVIPKTFDEFVPWTCEDCEKKLPTVQNCITISKRVRESTCLEVDPKEQAADTEEQRCRGSPSQGISKTHVKLNHGHASKSEEKIHEACQVADGHEYQHLIRPSKQALEAGDCLSISGAVEKLGKGSDLEERCRSVDNIQNNSGSEVSHSVSVPNRNQQDYHIPAEPVEDPVWRGDFSIMNKNQEMYDGFVAHVSNKACPKVYEEARLLKPLLHLNMLPKSAVWPKSFQKSDPSDESIALYFFPANESSERIFDGLVESMTKNDLALKATVENAELLLFSSEELPLLYWRFQGKHYLWGVFRGKQAPLSQSNRSDNVETCLAPTNATQTSVERNLKNTKTTSREILPPQRNVSSESSDSIELTQLAPTLVQYQQPVKQSLVTEMKKLNPPEFEGADCAAMVDKWIHEMEKAFDILGSSEVEKVALAECHLQGGACNWWLMEKKRSEGDEQPYTWTKFKKALKDKYFPADMNAQMETDIIHLNQGNMIVSEYEAEFVKLAKDTPILVADEAIKARTSEDSLRNEASFSRRGLPKSPTRDSHRSRKRNESHNVELNHLRLVKKVNTRAQGYEENQGNKPKCTRCGKSHLEKDCHRTSGACFHCRDVGHKIAQCPNNPVLNEALVIGSMARKRNELHDLELNHERLVNTQAHEYEENEGNEPKCVRCGKSHLEKDCHRITGACFHCGDVGHKIAQCPNNPVPNKALVIGSELSNTKIMESNFNSKRNVQRNGEPSHTRQVKKVKAHANQYQGNEQKCTRCNRKHLGRCWNTGACFGCREFGHKVAQCPYGRSSKGKSTHEQNDIVGDLLLKGDIFRSHLF